jgi:predicted aspartyl protease
MAQALLRQGVAVPTPVSGYGLVDTGASRTCIDETTAKQMGLPLVDRVSIASASHSSTLRNVYPVTVEIVGLPHQIHALHAVGAALRSQGLVALLGRDVLESCTLFYNGVSGEITISV